MFRSANYLLFVNFEDFVTDIRDVAVSHASEDKPTWFFSGYDCDSLAYEPVTQFADFFISEFVNIPNSILELRTKSTQIRSLLSRPAQNNVVVAFSLSPQNVAADIELGAPPLNKRIEALQKLQQQGWRIGLRFDPIVWHRGYEQNYCDMFEAIFSMLDADQIDSVTLGGFRLPKDFYKTMYRLYPEHWLFNAGLTETESVVSYYPDIEKEVFERVSSLCLKHVTANKLFVYPVDKSIQT